MLKEKFDSQNQSFLENPYIFYKKLRDSHPIYWEEYPTKRWILTRFRDISSTLKNPEFIKPGPSALLNRLPSQVRDKVQPLERNLNLDILNQNPPDHTRLRGLVSHAFTPQHVEELRPHIRMIAEDLVNNFIHKGNFDLINDFSSQLPGFVIMEMLGIPKDSRAQIRQWSDNISALFGAARFGINPTVAALSANHSTVEFQSYIRSLISNQTTESKNLLTSLLFAQTEGHMLSEEELISNCMLLIGAGQETTTHAIGNGMLALLQNPHQLSLLQSNHTLIKSAVEELLRFDSPVQMMGRVAKSDTFISDQEIKVGEFVLMAVGAGNRDPEQFTEPDVLDISRPHNHHSSFGFGIHFCLGAPLARAELEIALQVLIHGRLKNLSLGRLNQDWNNDVDLRGLRSLPLNFTT